MIDINEFQEFSYSILGEKSSFEGTWTVSHDVVLASEFKGQIQCKGLNLFVIHTKGNVEGTIMGHDIDLYGKFEGHLVATGRLRVYPHAELSGKIEAGRLEVHPGSILNIEALVTGNPDNLPQ